MMPPPALHTQAILRDLVYGATTQHPTAHLLLMHVVKEKEKHEDRFSLSR